MTAVGGTSLYQATNDGARNATETAWSGAGSGCSAYEPKPFWQHDSGCSMRAVADVSAVADPATPVWAYDSYPYNNTTLGWAAVGGTSVAAPIVAGMYALAGGPSGTSYHPAGYPYAQPGSLNDVTSGSNGSCPSYLCNAGPGYDGPTGLGTPNGIRAFQPSPPSAPQGFVSGSYSDTAVLSWSPPATDGGATISGYNVYRSDQGTIPIASLSPSATSYTNIGLTNGVTYTYTVTAVSAVGEGASASASATPEPLDHLSITPAAATLTAGGSQSYAVLGFDSLGNSLGNETAPAKFSITPDGTCTGATCTATVAGAHTVVATLGGKSATANLQVNAGSFDHLGLSPSTANVAPYEAQTYSTQGLDSFDNSLGDATGSSTFSISPDGSCTGATCTAAQGGYHTVTATDHLMTAAAVSVGGSDICGTTTAGAVECWGPNQFGQLGDGTNAGPNICNGGPCSATPVDVSGLTSGVTAVSSGASYVCALTTEGGVKCWGSNQYGQLGNGTTTDSYMPADVFGLTSGVAAISASDNHTCALTSSGGVKCWGENGDGELGNGSFTNSFVPVDVSGLTSGVAAISSGGGGSCALTTTGGVKCWGYDGHGELGDGTTSSSSIPVDVSGLTSGVTAVAASDYNTCALTNGGGVKCWGLNVFGELGNGTSTGPQTCLGDPCSTMPVDVSGLTSGATAISAGPSGTHSLRIDVVGQHRMLGRQRRGSDSEMGLKPVRIPVRPTTSLAVLHR